MTCAEDTGAKGKNTRGTFVSVHVCTSECKLRNYTLFCILRTRFVAFAYFRRFLFLGASLRAGRHEFFFCCGLFGGDGDGLAVGGEVNVALHIGAIDLRAKLFKAA